MVWESVSLWCIGFYRQRIVPSVFIEPYLFQVPSIPNRSLYFHSFLVVLRFGGPVQDDMVSGLYCLGFILVSSTQSDTCRLSFGTQREDYQSFCEYLFPLFRNRSFILTLHVEVERKDSKSKELRSCLIFIYGTLQRHSGSLCYLIEVDESNQQTLGKTLP